MNIVHFRFFLILTTLIHSQNHLRFLNINQDCSSHISNCIQCSSNYTLCQKCKEHFQLSSDQTYCKDSKSKSKTTLTILISIIIPSLLITLSIFIGLFIKIKLSKKINPFNKTQNSSSKKKTSFPIHSKLKLTSSPQINSFHPNSISKFTNISNIPHISSEQPFPNQKLSTYHSNLNLISPHLNSDSFIGVNGGLISTNKRYQEDKNMKNNFVTEIRIGRNQMEKRNNGRKCASTNLEVVLKCGKCGSRNVYCTLSCNCCLCLEHFKEFTMSPNRKYVCEKHCTKIYKRDIIPQRIIPSVLINKTILSKLN